MKVCLASVAEIDAAYSAHPHRRGPSAPTSPPSRATAAQLVIVAVQPDPLVHHGSPGIE